MARHDARRGLRLACAVAACVLGSGVMVTNAAALLAPPPREATTITLSDDDNGAALFSAAGMAPGHPVSGCINVAYRADGYIDFRLHARSEGTGLARSLALLVEDGTGSRFGDCAGFRGTAVYRGTLGEFVGRHGSFAHGLELGVPGDTVERSFRITAEVLGDDSVQGADALATFTWEARPASAPLIALPTATPTATATATATEQAEPVDAVPSAASAPAPPGASITEPTPSRGGRLVPLGGRQPTGSLIDALVGGVVFVAQRAAFPGFLLLVAGTFVLAQDRIDRKEPKLALAPLHADPDLRFGEPGD